MEVILDIYVDGFNPDITDCVEIVVNDLVDYKQRSEPLFWGICTG